MAFDKLLEERAEELRWPPKSFDGRLRASMAV
jgi:hypothetical protein